MTTAKIKALMLSGVLVAVLVPQTAFAAAPEAAPPAPPRPIAECLAESDGSAEAFLACLREKAEALGLPDGWVQRVKTFLENHPDWRERLKNLIERRQERREALRERLEQRRERRQQRRDRLQEGWTDNQPTST